LFAKKIIFFFIIFFPFLTIGQTAGLSTYHALQFSESPRSIVLNNPMGIIDDDVNLGVYNPSLLNNKMHRSLSLNYVNYFSNINIASASFSFPIKNFGSAVLSTKSFNYGKFIRTDFSGQELGSFYANEQVLIFGIGKKVFSNFNFGTSIKLFFSNLENFSSFGLVSDLSINYFNQNKNLGISFLARNIGRQISYYHKKNEMMPFELIMGFSKKLAHLPLTFSVNYNNLEKWDFLNGYNIMNENENLGNLNNNFTKTFFSHISTSAELKLGKVLDLRCGYNARKRYELTSPELLGMVGFSWGIGLNFSKFKINYGRSTFHLAGSPNYFSLHINI